MTRPFRLLLLIHCIAAVAVLLMGAPGGETNRSAFSTGQHAFIENQTEWEEGSEGSMSYDYGQHEESGRVELSDDWLILHVVEEEPIDAENDFEDDLQGEEESDGEESLDCDREIPKKKKERTLSSRKDEFYFMHKKYGKKALRSSSSKKNWKNCCIRGKRVGNSRRTFLADDLVRECQERARHLASRTSRHCKWIFWSCCEARALRRFYVHYKPGGTDTG